MSPSLGLSLLVRFELKRTMKGTRSLTRSLSRSAGKREEENSSLPRQGLDNAEDRQEHLLGFQTLPTANLVQAKEEQAGRAPDHDKNLKKSIV